MEGISKAIPAPSKIELGGKMYDVSSISLEDLSVFQEQYVKPEHKKIQREKIDAAKELWGDGKCPPELYKEIIAPITQEQIDRAAATIDGTAFLLWRSLQKKQPDITLEQTRQMLTVDKIPEILACLGLGDDDDDKDAEKNVKTLASQ